VEVNKGRKRVWLMWTHVDRGGGSKTSFFVNIINGWALKLQTVQLF